MVNCEACGRREAADLALRFNARARFFIGARFFFGFVRITLTVLTVVRETFALFGADRFFPDFAARDFFLRFGLLFIVTCSHCLTLIARSDRGTKALLSRTG